jgi:hypothetical protein
VTRTSSSWVTITSFFGFHDRRVPAVQAFVVALAVIPDDDVVEGERLEDRRHVAVAPSHNDCRHGAGMDHGRGSRSMARRSSLSHSSHSGSTFASGSMLRAGQPIHVSPAGTSLTTTAPCTDPCASADLDARLHADPTPSRCAILDGDVAGDDRPCRRARRRRRSGVVADMTVPLGTALTDPGGSFVPASTVQKALILGRR